MHFNTYTERMIDMAISVKSIREMEFSRNKHGYDMNEVDDFLDEIAEQLTAIIEENLALNEQLEAQSEQAAQVTEAPAQPAYNENSYFKNLESTLRETLISGQRIADDTVAKAQREAEEIIAAAKEEAKVIVNQANAELETAKVNAGKIVTEAEAKATALKEAIAGYKAAIKAMIETQQKLIAE